MQAGRQQSRHDQQQVLVHLAKAARALADDSQGPGHLSPRREGRSKVTHDPQLLPHRQAFERLAFARVANIEHPALHFFVDCRKRVLERHPKSGVDGGPALNGCGNDLERVALDPGVKGGSRIERLVKTGQRLVDQLGERPGEIDDHQVADQAEGWLAVGAHERAPTVISRRP